jgi:hypothetical protein
LLLTGDFMVTKIFWPCESSESCLRFDRTGAGFALDYVSVPWIGRVFAPLEGVARPGTRYIVTIAKEAARTTGPLAEVLTNGVSTPQRTADASRE